MREERKKEVTTIYSPYKTKIGMEIHLWDAKVATAHDHDFYEFALCIKGEAKEWRNGEIRVKHIVYFLATFSSQIPIAQETELNGIRLMDYETALSSFQFESSKRILTEAHCFLTR